MSLNSDNNETCDICKMMVRNLAAHNRINHKKRKKSSGFTAPSTSSKTEIKERLPSCVKYQISNRSPRMKLQGSSPKKKIPEEGTDDVLGGIKKIKTEVPSREESLNKSLSMLNQLLNEEEVNKMIGDEESGDKSRSFDPFSFGKRINHKDRLSELGIARTGLKTGNLYADNKFKRCPTCNISFKPPEGINRITASYKIIEHIHECKKKVEESRDDNTNVESDEAIKTDSETRIESENKMDVINSETPIPDVKDTPSVSKTPMTSIYIKNEPEEDMDIKTEPLDLEEDISSIVGIEPQVLLTEDVKQEVYF